MRALKDMHGPRIIAAGALTILSYVVLTGYDVLALRYLGRRLAYGRTALASFIGYVFNMNLGLSVLGSTAVRYRLYSTWGLGAVEIGKIVAFCALTTGLGLCGASGAVFLFGDTPGQADAWMTPWHLRGLGILLLLAVAGYVVACARVRRPLQLRSWQLALPNWRIGLLQVILAPGDLLAAGGVLFLLLPANDVSYPAFLSVYLFAVVAGLISHVPGGLGVFETVILLGLPTQAPDSAVLASLVAFRGIYYLFPFATGILLLAAHEVLQHRRRIARVAEGLSRGISAIAPQALAVSTFLGGLVLLASGATPAEGARLRWLVQFLPLPVLEISHFLGSVAGTGLLFLARGLQRRLNAAWYLTGLLLAAGVIFSLLKGFEWEEAIVLAFMLGVVVVSRSEFYRKSSLLDQRFTPGWIIAISVALAGTVWLGFFAFEHVEYSSELWWHFSLRGDAPRFLRASAGAVIVVLVIAVARLLRHPPARPVSPTPAVLDEAAVLVAAAPASQAWLALLGDKTLLFSPTRQSLLMYAVAGRSWVALGDPLGDPEEQVDLVWRFRELCDEQGGWAVFYEVSAATLSRYVDLGLSLFKLGEEARVPLRGFSLEGPAHRTHRNTCSRLEREGCSFVVWPPAETRARIPELRAISDDWLSRKRTREKGFSLGFFDEDYVARFPVGVVLRDGAAVAFANLWPGGGREELSVDFMRFSAAAPPNVMEYLFLQLFLHGATEGYAWFNLGMAPLSGIENHPLAPWWNRLGAVLFQHGEHFYNFQGLRQYKEKFDPVWQPKYLACPGGLILPRVLTGVASLIAGGVAGVVKR